MTLAPLVSDGGLDGRIRYHVSSGSDFTVQTNLPCVVGDRDCTPANNGYGYRSFLCFPLTSIPAGANVTQVTLRVPQTAVTSGTDQANPYLDHGDVAVYHLTLTNGTSLTAADCLKTPEAAMGVLSSDASLGLKSLDVTSAVRADLQNGRTWSHYRIQFTATASDADFICEEASLNDGEGNAGSQRPELVVTYQP